MEPRLKWNKIILAAKRIVFHLDVVPCWNKIILGRSTDGGGSGLKFFKIILF